MSLFVSSACFTQTLVAPTLIPVTVLPTAPLNVAVCFFSFTSFVAVLAE
jgi:hypothetical protein